jgi:hypothetical protein
MGCTQRVLAYDGHDVMKYGVFRDALSDFDYFDFVCRGFRRKKIDTHNMSIPASFQVKKLS